MKNNKGVTLVELLVVIVVMGIIAGFAIPAVGNIIENANKDAVLNDAIQVEQAAKLYCSTNNCPSGDLDLTYGVLSGFIDGLDPNNYADVTATGTGEDTTALASTTVIATRVGGEWGVYLEGSGVSGNLEFGTAADFDTRAEWLTPSDTDNVSRDDVTVD